MQCVVVCRKNRPLVFHDAFADGIVPMCLGAQNPPSNLEIEVNAAHVASPARLWLGKYCVVGLRADEENNENQGWSNGNHVVSPLPLKRVQGYKPPAQLA